MELLKEYRMGRFAVNVIGNIIAFVPLGFLTPLILDKRSIKKISLVGAGISLAFEIIQLATGIGSFDVDDLILNTFGTILGYIILKLLTRFLKIEQIGL